MGFSFFYEPLAKLVDSFATIFDSRFVNYA